MASIKKILYEKKNGQASAYWQVAYYDSEGKRHRKNFGRQSTAFSFKVKVESELLSGTHITEKDTVTLEHACTEFLADFEKLMESGKRERSTYRQYKNHIRHIKLHDVSGYLLNQLQAKDCREFVNDLKTSDIQTAKIMVTLRMVLRFSEERGWVRGNPASAIRVRKETRKDRLQIPEKKEIRKLLDAAGEKELAFLCLGFFCGLRASELRGLPKENLKFGVNPHVIVNQRADQWGKIGKPKTDKSSRRIPMGGYTAKAVKKWAEKAAGTLLFGSSRDTPMVYQNLYNRLWKPLFLKAEIKDVYGFHVMRHVCASLWIEQGYNPKQVQEMLGHATLAMTMDTYGHLWHNPDNKKLVNAAEKSLLATK